MTFWCFNTAPIHLKPGPGRNILRVDIIIRPPHPQIALEILGAYRDTRGAREHRVRLQAAVVGKLRGKSPGK